MQTALIRRSRLQLLTDILSICKTPLPKTRLMQKANLSYKNLQKCLGELESLGLVVLLPETTEYVITKKGIVFLAKWGQLQLFLTPEEKLSIKTKRCLQSL